VLNNICAALPSGSGPRRLVLPRRQRLLPVLGAVAAAVLAVVAVGQFLPRNRPVPPGAVANPGNLRQPLDLADAHEVDIISIGDDDSSNLLVGRVPVREVLLLAGPNDVTNVGAEPFQGVTPTLRHNGDASMIVPIPAKDAP
jgi:hypothetical protein